MLNLKNYIAYLLLWIFSFPLVYQSSHIAWHHGEESISCQTGCSSLCGIQDTDTGDHVFSVNTDPCPVCHYEFSVRDIQDAKIYEAKIPEVATWFDHSLVTSLQKQIHIIDAPRGPPIIT
ncbi:MAG: hypothetical protein KDC05_12765 [Bacteroidales bacterium]|nr:hypothetical protein [Bacteroidales bacterium]